MTCVANPHPIGIRLFKELVGVDNSVDIMSGIDLTEDNTYDEYPQDVKVDAIRLNPSPQRRISLFSKQVQSMFEQSQQHVKSIVKVNTLNAVNTPREPSFTSTRFRFPVQLDEIKTSSPVKNRFASIVIEADNPQPIEAKNESKKTYDTSTVDDTQIPNQTSASEQQQQNQNSYFKQTQETSHEHTREDYKRNDTGEEDDPNSKENMRLKQYYWAQLEHQRLTRKIVHSRIFSMQDSVEELRYEFELHDTNMVLSTQVAQIKKFVSTGFYGIEFINNRFGPFVPIEGLSDEFTKPENFNAIDKPIEKLYLRFWRKSNSSPWMEILMFFGGFMVTLILKNIVERKLFGQDKNFYHNPSSNKNNSNNSNNSSSNNNNNSNNSATSSSAGGLGNIFNFFQNMQGRPSPANNSNNNTTNSDSTTDQSNTDNQSASTSQKCDAPSFRNSVRPRIARPSMLQFTPIEIKEEPLESAVECEPQLSIKSTIVPQECLIALENLFV